MAVIAAVVGCVASEHIEEVLLGASKIKKVCLINPNSNIMCGRHNISEHERIVPSEYIHGHCWIHTCVEQKSKNVWLVNLNRIYDLFDTN